jgi:hypothetical protein
LHCSAAKQQEEGDGSFAIAFFFAPSCVVKKRRRQW